LYPSLSDDLKSKVGTLNLTLIGELIESKIKLNSDNGKNKSWSIYSLTQINGNGFNKLYEKLSDISIDNINDETVDITLYHDNTQTVLKGLKFFSIF